MQNNRFIQLLYKWKDGTIMPAEYQELSAYVQREDNREIIINLLSQSATAITEFLPYDEGRFDPILQKILAADKAGKVVELPFYRKPIWKRWAAAAVLVLIVGALWFTIDRGAQENSDNNKIANAKDVDAPKSTKATITLADGTKIYLDSAGNGTLAQQGSVEVKKSNEGEIIYESAGLKSPVSPLPSDVSPLPSDVSRLTYNTLTNPRGSKVVSLTLSDGTNVWLNSESSLKYPVAFNGNTREVEITGEAYFEVAHNAAKPFHVKKGFADITVLGTHFNVKAYDNEEVLKVTLLEGSVKFSAPTVKQLSNSIILKPGQQGQLQTTNYKLQTINTVDIDAVVAWKNGYFSLQGTDIYSLMRQVSRWYDVDVVYAGAVPARKFGGSVSRDVNLSDVLNALKEYGINTEFKEGKIFIR